MTVRIPRASSEDAFLRMKSQRSRDTRAEVAIRSLLHRRGLRFRVHYQVLGRRTADIAFTRHRIAVFVDGCFWHGCSVHGTWPKANASWWREKIEANQRRDRETDLRLTEIGWRVVRIWEHEDQVSAVNRVVAVVEASIEEHG